jgi:hypothetical protein
LKSKCGVLELEARGYNKNTIGRDQIVYAHEDNEE